MRHVVRGVVCGVCGVCAAREHQTSRVPAARHSGLVSDADTEV